MSLPSEIKSIYQTAPFIAHTTPGTYAAGAHNVLAITGGPVLITGVIEYCDTVLAGATTTTIAIGALAIDGGLLAINAGGQFAMVASPMDPGGVIAKVASALVIPNPSLLGFAGGINTILSGPGVNIVWTFGGVAMGALEQVSLYVLYYKLDPSSLIS